MQLDFQNTNILFRCSINYIEDFNNATYRIGQEFWSYTLWENGVQNFDSNTSNPTGFSSFASCANHAIANVASSVVFSFTISSGLRTPSTPLAP